MILTKNVPCLTIGGGGNRTSLKNGLVFDEILFTARKNGAVVDEKFAGDVRIGDDDVKLISQVKRVKRAVLLSPAVQSAFRIVGEVGKAHQGAGRDAIAVLVHNILPDDEEG